MRSHIIRKNSLFISVFLSYSGMVGAENVFYENDFESGAFALDTPYPVWLIKRGVSDKVGPGNLFEITTVTSHSGKFSLRFNYEGRNGKCNECGFSKITQKSGYNSVTYVVDSNGNDLTSDPFFAYPNRIIYNNSDGYSKWRIQSAQNKHATNDMLTLVKLKDGINGITASFNGNDSISIARQCGVDGKVARKLDRRSDCDLAIMWFSNVSQNYGQSIYRRVYLKADIKSPPFHQKLNYWRPPKPSDEIVLFAETDLKDDTSIHPMLIGLKDKGGNNKYLPPMSFKPGVWYYVEQEFKAQSAPGKLDGEYRLWLAEAGKETNQPVIVATNLDLPPVKSTSFWGNHQHEKSSIGSWYIDDIKISDRKIGPTSASGSNIAPPMPPSPK